MTPTEKYLAGVKARQGTCPCKHYHCGICGLQTDTPALAGHSDIPRLVAMVEAARKLSRGIAAEYADQTQGPSETLGKIAMRAEEYDAELDRIAGEGM